MRKKFVSTLLAFTSLALKYRSHCQELGADIIIAAHLSEMQDSLLQQNLLRIVEPFSRVEVEFDRLFVCFFLSSTAS